MCNKCENKFKIHAKVEVPKIANDWEHWLLTGEVAPAKRQVWGVDPNNSNIGRF